MVQLQCEALVEEFGVSYPFDCWSGVLCLAEVCCCIWCVQRSLG
ncbi:hypothetical protein LINPERPRIM_LOCUS1197 [Linum perenne]